MRRNLLTALRDTRRIKPGYNNWLLFSAMVETLLLEMGEEWDAMRVDLALRTCAAWYVGDGFFKDGPEYHHDYYNSFVIQPFLWTILRVLRAKGITGYEKLHALLEQTTVRYAEVLERGISPDGHVPALRPIDRLPLRGLPAPGPGGPGGAARPSRSPRLPCARPSPP